MAHRNFYNTSQDYDSEINEYPEDIHHRDTITLPEEYYDEYLEDYTDKIESPPSLQKHYGLDSRSHEANNMRDTDHIDDYEDEEYYSQIQDHHNNLSDPYVDSSSFLYSNQQRHCFPRNQSPAQSEHYLSSQRTVIRPTTQTHRCPTNHASSGPQVEPSYPRPNFEAHNNLPPSSALGYNEREQRESCDSSRGSNPRNSHGIRLRPVSNLPDIYRGMFKFGVFNAVQSTCFDDVIDTNENIVMSKAPTGSGKTVLFEFAIIRLLTQAKNTGATLKCVYMAPTKALCSERYRDWSTKFDPLGVKCCELTGDTSNFGKNVWGDAKKATIIITTSEKWDSLTRHWRDHVQILSQIQLFLVDEVHILNESRGSTLEVVVSRMKTRGSSVRFILVSATVPNIDDIASWIGSSGGRCNPAKIFEFGEEFRPCKLTRFVIGVPRHHTQNDFVFTKNLDYKLFGVLQTHSVGKPILVFCSTRKGVFATAEKLMKDYIEAEKNKQSLPWSHPPRIEKLFHDKRLTEFASYGIGVHHAGLTLDDRRTTEDLYLNKVLRIVVATSTLAVGVNLRPPFLMGSLKLTELTSCLSAAHMVVIKGVQTFQNNATIEYSDLDIMQMLGRAGRPQFDKDGIAIIFCEAELEDKYKSLVQGKTVLESSLHTNLSEHLNSEVGLGTITSITSAKDWLRNSFLFQRIRRNSAHYALGKEDNQTWEERVDDLVTQSVARLRETQLIEYAGEGDKTGDLRSTEYGDIMSKLYIRQSTMSLVLALPERASLRDILEMISASEELSETKMRASEKTALNKLRKHNDIRFEIKKIEKTSDKVFLLIQAVLGGISLSTPDFKSPDSQPHLEAFGIFRHISRIARVVVEVAVVKKLGTQVKHGLELVRCLTAKAWEDRPVVLRQIEQIGEKSLKVLAEHGITSLELLRKQDALRIETLLNRRPPFGQEVLASVRELPKYSISISEIGVSSNGGDGPVEIELSIECGLEGKQLPVSKSKKQKGSGFNMTAVLTLTSDMDLVDFRRIPTKALVGRKTFEVTVGLTRPSQSVIVLITSETIAGVKVSEVYKPKVSPREYPTMYTRPPTSTDIDLAGLEDDPDFWNMNIDDKGEEIVVRDLTKRNNGSSSVQDSLLPEGSKRSNVLQILDAPRVKPKKKLINGNYECNHPCKDKTKCRHLCCRDGLSEPPHPSRKKNTYTEALKSEHTVEPPKAKKRTGIALKGTDRRLDNLESLHERTNVMGGLKLSPGRRLKLDPPEKLKKKRTPLPDLNVELTDLDDFRPPSSMKMYYRDDADEGDEDDDLLDPHEILKPTAALATPSSETTYSSSDIDSLIRAVPLDEIGETRPSKYVGDSAKKNDGKKKPAAPQLSTKRTRDFEHPQPPPKRSKYKETTGRTASPPGPHIQHINKQEEPLFAEISDEERPFGYENVPEQCRLYEDVTSTPMEDSFSWDLDFIDSPITPALTNSTSQVSKGDSIDILEPIKLDTFHKIDEDEFTELDTWLSSGAVDVV